MDYLLALLVSIKSVDSWKEQVYAQKYDTAVVKYVKAKELEATKSSELSGSISWYAKGRNSDGTPFNPNGLTTACWSDYPKGTKFKVTFNGKSVVVTCTDRGNFKPLGRVLDLSAGAFKQLAPLSKGIIRGAKVEVLP